MKKTRQAGHRGVSRGICAVPVFVLVFITLAVWIGVSGGLIGALIGRLTGTSAEPVVVTEAMSGLFFMDRESGNVLTKHSGVDNGSLEIYYCGYADRVVFELDEPVTEFFVLRPFVMLQGTDEYTALSELEVLRGQKYIEVGIDRAVDSMLFGFGTSGYLELDLKDITVNSSNYHIADKVRSIPWAWVLICSIFLTHLMMNVRRFEKKAFSVMLDLVCLMALVLYRKFLWGSFSCLYSVYDGFSQYLPTYEFYSRTMRETHSLPAFTLSIGFGSVQSYDVLLYPLNAIPAICGVLFGSYGLEMSYIWVQVLKIALAAMCMYLFLREIGISALPRMFAGILYAFSGVIIFRGNWVFLADELYIAMLVLWAAERYVRRDQWQFIPLTILLLAACLGVFYVYLYALLLIVYATVRFIYGKNPMKRYLPYIFKCGAVFIVGVLVWGVMLIGFSWSMFGTERFTDTTSYFSLNDIFQISDMGIWVTALMRTYSADSLGIFDAYTGSLNLLEGPLFYCGLSALYLAAQGIIGAEKRKRCFLLLGCAAAVAFILLPFVTDVMSAFIRNEELGLRSYRYSAQWICVMIVVLAAYGVEYGLKRGRFHTQGLMVSGVALITVFLFCYLISPQLGFTPNLKVAFLVIFFLIAWLAALMSYRRTRSATMMLAALMVLEACVFSGTTINASYRSALTNYKMVSQSDTGYYSHVQDAVDYLREDDSSLYRIGGVVGSEGNERFCAPLYFGSFGSSYYTNIDSGTYAFMKAVYPEAFAYGVGSKFSRGVDENLLLSTLTGYKYYIGLDNTPAPYGYVLIKRFGNAYVYENIFAQGFGTAYSRYIYESDFMELDQLERQALLLSCVVLPDDTETSLDPVSSFDISRNRRNIRSFAEAKDRTRNLEAHVMQWYRDLADAREQMEIGEWHEDRIKGTISTDGDRIVFIPIANLNGWTVLVDGSEADIIETDLAFIGVEIPAGEHSIELSYRSETLNLGLAVSLFGILLYATAVLLDKLTPFMRWMRLDVVFSRAEQ